MAKKYIQYECEICNRRYQQESEANECQNGHFIPTDITKYSYDIMDKKPKYPLRINVKVKDEKGNEKIIEYRRAGNVNK